MTNGTADVTRGEFDLLRGVVDRAQTRLDAIDDHGTRGVGIIQTQILDLVKDVTELKVDMNSRFDSHAKVHDQDEMKRVTGRRWMIGTVITSLAAMAAIIGLLIEVLQHVH